jgi:ubiquinone biosynthesis protein Coq4
MGPLRRVAQVRAISRAAVAFARVVRDPDRLGDVFAFIDEGVLENPELIAPVVHAFRSTPEGARALEERIRVGEVDLDTLARSPDGSLGACFAAHMRANGLDPNALPRRPAATDAEYVAAHLYETHDIWHVVTDLSTDKAGELGLHGFYLAQAPSRASMGCLSMGVLNMFLFEFDGYERRLNALARGWVLGRRAASLLGVDWAARWSQPLAEVRRALRIDLPFAEAFVGTAPA